MFTAPNAGPKTLSGTHTFVIGKGNAYVIDPGPEIPRYLDSVAAWLREQGSRVNGILVSHSHPDHAPGAKYLKNLLPAPVHASAKVPPDDAREMGADEALEDGQRFEVDGDVLRVMETPGHAFDQLAFWLEEARILFAGDTVLGEGSSLVAPPEGNMLLYMQTLERMKDLDPRLIAPGHGPVISSPQDKLDEYIRHRRERESQILHALRAGSTTIRQIVERVYVDLDPRLIELAVGSVHAQLLMLQTQDRVTEREGKFHLNEDLG